MSAQSFPVEPSVPLEQLLAAFPVSAGAFVVTLYGDVVAPRGGEVWMGTLIETCAVVGLAESRVRTAVSRLVAAGRIAGEKVGRRSYYRLTPEAEREFAEASALVYAPVQPAPLRGWHLVALPAGPDREAAARHLVRLRFGLVGPQLAILPDRGAALPPLLGTRFAARTDDDLTGLVAAAWPLAPLAEAMRRFADAFAPLEGRTFEPAEALGLRLMLVHVFRDIALRDPLLPAGLVPEGWPGAAARRLFASLYRALSPAAEAAVDAGFVDRDGALDSDGLVLRRRLRRLAR
jgi:phenylacetic acid degradation operon negative regulatory protein